MAMHRLTTGSFGWRLESFLREHGFRSRREVARKLAPDALRAEEQRLYRWTLHTPTRADLTAFLRRLLPALDAERAADELLREPTPPQAGPTADVKASMLADRLIAALHALEASERVPEAEARKYARLARDEVRAALAVLGLAFLVRDPNSRGAVRRAPTILVA